MDITIKNDRVKMKNYMGNAYQMGGTRHYCLSDGSSNGSKCIDVRTGSGFEYTVVCDRGLDISLASYKGTNLVYLTENMEAAPAFFDAIEGEWIRTFSAGLLTTCGPTNIGPSCVDGEEKLGLHGRWSSLAGRRVCDLTDFENGEIVIEGDLHDSAPFGHKIKIHRTIKSEFGKSSVIIEDTIKNEGSKPSPLNVLYHINFGYPLLDENAFVHVPSTKHTGYDEYTNERMAEQKTVKSPCGENFEKNYLHTFEKTGGDEKVWIVNEKLDEPLGVYIHFDSKKLPYLTQWVLEDIKDYVLALEPANVPCEPRNMLRQKDLLPFIAPGETVNFKVEIGVVSGRENIKKEMGK